MSLGFGGWAVFLWVFFGRGEVFPFCHIEYKLPVCICIRYPILYVFTPILYMCIYSHSHTSYDPCRIDKKPKVYNKHHRTPTEDLVEREGGMGGGGSRLRLVSWL